MLRQIQNQLVELVKAVADRQAMHEVIREHSLATWDVVQKGAPNPLANFLSDDERYWLSCPRAACRNCWMLEAIWETHRSGVAEFLKQFRAVTQAPQGGPKR